MRPRCLLCHVEACVNCPTPLAISHPIRTTAELFAVTVSKEYNFNQFWVIPEGMRFNPAYVQFNLTRIVFIPLVLIVSNQQLLVDLLFRMQTI